MRPAVAAAAGAVLTLVLVVCAGVGYVVTTGLRAAPQPSAVEAAMARRVRGAGGAPGRRAARQPGILVAGRVVRRTVALCRSLCVVPCRRRQRQDRAWRRAVSQGARHAGGGHAASHRRRAVLRDRARHPVHRHAGVVHRDARGRDRVVAARAVHPASAAAHRRRTGPRRAAHAALGRDDPAGDRGRELLERRRAAAIGSHGSLLAGDAS